MVHFFNTVITIQPINYDGEPAGEALDRLSGDETKPVAMQQIGHLDLQWGSLAEKWGQGSFLIIISLSKMIVCSGNQGSKPVIPKHALKN